MTLSNKDFIMTSECDRNVNQFPLKIFTRWGWLLGIVSTFWVNTANGQITPDSTLPNNSDVKVEENTSIIEGGTTAGSNLFHSFKEFSLSTGNEAHFNNAVDINNIITRVTGGSVSRIDGLIKAEGSANLFLINPNGIVFGENAKLDIGGSFIGATADSIKFADDIEFSAKNPQNTPLLTVSVPLGLQYGANPGKIEINGKGEPPREPPEVYEPQFGLQVLSNKTLALLGGDVLLNGATLKADSGRIELGSAVGEGLVNIEPLKEGFDFNFDNIENFGEIQLSQNTAVDTSGNGAGSIKVTSKNLSLADNSVISSTQTGTEKSAGIVINAKESVNLNGENDTFIPSGLYANNVSGDVTENTGNININTQQLTVQNGAIVTTNAWGAGNSGDIDIQTNNLKVESGAKINVNTYNAGNTGKLNINAENVNVVGTRDRDNNDFPSFLSVSVEKKSTGNAENLNITTSKLLVDGGAFISANTSGKGNGGNMIINATESIKITGQGGKNSENQPYRSGLFVVGEKPSTGDSGSLTINTNKMLVENLAFISVSNNSQGSAGGLKITTNELLLKNNARFFTGRVTEGKNVGDLTIKTNTLRIEDASSIQAGASGNSGNLNIDAQDVQVSGTGNGGNTPSSLTISTKRDVTGDGGSLNINTQRLLIQKGAFVSTSTSGLSNGGALNINAEDVKVIGMGGNNKIQYPSGLFATAEPSKSEALISTGNAGTLNINTKRMLVKDGGIVSTAANNNGKGGNLIVNALDNIKLIGTGNEGKSPSYLNSSASQNSENAGDVNITTKQMLVKDGAFVATTTSGNGSGGNLTVNTADVQVIGKGGNNPEKNNQPYLSGLFTSAEEESTGEKAGDLTINTKQILIQDGGVIAADTFSKSSGGNLTINADTLQLTENVGVFARSEGSGEAGNIKINLKEYLNADKGQIITQAENSKGGDIEITAGKNIFLRNNSDIKATLSSTAGSGGSIKLNANAIVALEDSDILAFASEGKGGDITFNTRAFFSNPLYRSRSQTAESPTKQELEKLDGNNRVDVDATGRVSTGNIIGIPDINFLENSLTELAQNPIDSEALVASSCVVRSKERSGTFFITGKSNFSHRPNDTVPSDYSAVEVQSIPDNTSIKPRRRWKIGDPIVEPSGVYRLENERRVLSRECGR